MSDAAWSQRSCRSISHYLFNILVPVTECRLTHESESWLSGFPPLVQVLPLSLQDHTALLAGDYVWISIIDILLIVLFPRTWILIDGTCMPMVCRFNGLATWYPGYIPLARHDQMITNRDSGVRVNQPEPGQPSRWLASAGPGPGTWRTTTAVWDSESLSPTDSDGAAASYGSKFKLQVPKCLWFKRNYLRLTGKLKYWLRVCGTWLLPVLVLTMKVSMAILVPVI